MRIAKKKLQKIVELVDAGLCRGLGSGATGDMCVEHVICKVLDRRYGDSPECVNGTVANQKITLNDSFWSSNAARAKGMRKLAIMQLGTKRKNFDVSGFLRYVDEKMQQLIPDPTIVAGAMGRAYRYSCSNPSGEATDAVLFAAARIMEKALRKFNPQGWEMWKSLTS